MRKTVMIALAAMLVSVALRGETLSQADKKFWGRYQIVSTSTDNGRTWSRGGGKLLGIVYPNRMELMGKLFRIVSVKGDFVDGLRYNVLSFGTSTQMVLLETRTSGLYVVTWRENGKELYQFKCQKR